jgi:hypothetical protein
VREWKTFDGKPMAGWYLDLIDFLSRDGGWERAHYEDCKIRELSQAIGQITH